MPCKNCYPNGKCSNNCTYELPQKLERPQLQGGRVEADFTYNLSYYISISFLWFTVLSLIGFFLFLCFLKLGVF